MKYCGVWEVRALQGPLRIQRRITYSLLLISQSAIKMKRLYTHTINTSKNLPIKFTKRGKWKHFLSSHACSHRLTVTDGNCPACYQKANWQFISSDSEVPDSLPPSPRHWLLCLETSRSGPLELRIKNIETLKSKSTTVKKSSKKKKRMLQCHNLNILQHIVCFRKKKRL